MKDITRDMPITLILPGTGIIATRRTIHIINPHSKENTGLTSPDGASTMNVLSGKIIGMEGIEQEIARCGTGTGLVVAPYRPHKCRPARDRHWRLIPFDPLPKDLIE